MKIYESVSYVLLQYGFFILDKFNLFTHILFTLHYLLSIIIRVN